MPRIRITEPPSTQPGTWEQIIANRIRTGNLVPIISNSVDNDLFLNGHDALIEAYAKYSGFPLNQTSLPQMAQIKGIIDEQMADPLALRSDYVNFVKNLICDLAEVASVAKEVLSEVEAQFDRFTLAQCCEQLDYPKFDHEPCASLLILASFEVPIFITTGYHNFLETALRRAGKAPRTEVCRWHKNIEYIPSVFDGGYEPSRAEPLVYHLHGFDEYPDSLVLTEDDYFRFLVACTQNVGRDTDPVHKRVRRAMSDSSLMLLGYSLRNWDFRSLFWSVIEPRTRRLTSVLSIQLQPDELENLYQQRYFGEYEFHVYWGQFRDYLQQLQRVVPD